MAATLSVECRGSRHDMAAFSKEDYSAAEAHILSTRPDPIEAILPAMEKLKGFPLVQQSLADRAYEDLRRGVGSRYVSRGDVLQWLETIDGLVWAVGRILRRKFTDVTDSEVNEAFTTLKSEKAE